jgi:hypothetical protein
MDAAPPNGKYIFHLKKEKSDERRIEEKEKKNKNITSSPPKHIDADYIVLRIPASLYTNLFTTSPGEREKETA